MGIAGNVLVQGVHELESVLLAPHLNPAGDVEISGARRARIGHDHMALVDGLGQVLPGFRNRQIVLLAFDGVIADRRHVGTLAHPQWRVVLGVHIQRVQFFDPLGRVSLEVIVWDQLQKDGRGHTPDDIGPGVVLLGKELGAHDAGRVADPFDVDVRVVLLERVLEFGQLVRLDRGVDQQVRLGDGNAAANAKGEDSHGQGRREPFQQIGSHEICLHLPGKRCAGECLSWAWCGWHPPGRLVLLFAVGGHATGPLPALVTIVPQKSGICHTCLPAGRAGSPGRPVPRSLDHGP